MKYQRRGIVALVLLIVLFLGINYWWRQNTLHKRSYSEEETIAISALQKRIDSLKHEKRTHQPKIYPFNPNFISDYKGYTLGMSPAEIDRLHRFREKDKWINSVKDFKRVTGVSDSLLHKLSPNFKFPAWVVQRNRKKKEHQSIENRSFSLAKRADLNTATADELQEINGIGPVLSHRIVRYRFKLKKFIDNKQLKDIYGLDYATRSRILERFTVKNDAVVKKLNLNNASVIEMSQNVYVDYELARAIRNYRILHEGIHSFEELASIERFPGDKIDRLKLYFKID